MDRVDEWRLFVSVATRRSFVEAARAERRSPQAVTRAIASLESRLGTRLLHRTTRSVSLTDEGARTLENARRVLAELDQLEAGREADPTPRGAIAITAPVLFGQLHVVPVVAELLAKHPAVEARLTLLDRVVSLAEEAVDVAIRIGELPDSALRARRVGTIHSVLCASAEYLSRRGAPRDVDALARHDVIAFTATTPIAERWSFRAPTTGARERSVAVRPRLVVNTGQAAIDAALEGLGIVRLLSYQVDALVRERRLRVVLPEHEPVPVPVHVVQLPGPQTRAAAAFAELAVERLSSRLAPGAAARARGTRRRS